jgi:hypothetical protein
MTKRAAFVPVLLLTGLIVAVVGATAALRLIGDGAFGPGGRALSQADVRQSLAQHPPAGAGGIASASSPGSARPAVTPSHRPRRGRPAQGATGAPAPGHRPVAGSFASSGGTVFAACSAGRVTLTSWIPAQGYGSDGVSRGPAPSAWVKFKSSSAEITVTATCGGGQPRFAASADDHGGGRGGEGGGGGGSGRGGGSGH